MFHDIFFTGVPGIAPHQQPVSLASLHAGNPYLYGLPGGLPAAFPGLPQGVAPPMSIPSSTAALLAAVSSNPMLPPGVAAAALSGLSPYG